MSNRCSELNSIIRSENHEKATDYIRYVLSLLPKEVAYTKSDIKAKIWGVVTEITRAGDTERDQHKAAQILLKRFFEYTKLYDMLAKVSKMGIREYTIKLKGERNGAN